MTNNKLAAAFRLPPKLSNLLGLLMQEDTVSTELAQHELGTKYAARVSFYRLRKRIFPYGIIVQSQYGGLYWLDPHMKQRVEEKINGHLH
jgi:hypothetical protein